MDDNPYADQIKATQNQPAPQDQELATLGQRFLAALVDLGVGILCAIPYLFILIPLVGTGKLNMAHMGDQIINGIISSSYGFVLFAVVHGYFLLTNGQTIGKKVLGIKIVQTDNQQASLIKLLFARYLPISICSMFPLLNILPLVDVLFIFRSDRRCVHDMIAGTKVVQC